VTQRTGAGRPERPIDEDSPFAEFASRLRTLRMTAELSVRDLATLTNYSASSISAAASGRTLPSLDLTLAIATVCGEDPTAWTKLWHEQAVTRRTSRAETGESGGRRTPDTNPLFESAGVAPRSANADIFLPDEGNESAKIDPRILGDNGSDGTRREDPAKGHTASPRSGLRIHVSTVSGQKVLVAEGTRLVFGRGPGVDLIIAAGRGLSRRAGLVTAMATGAWIANISRTHALYVEGDGYQVRLPRMEHDGEPANGWFVHGGTALVGSRAMLDEGQSLVVTVTGHYDTAAQPDGRHAGAEFATAGTGAGRTGNHATGTGLVDEGEWTDEVRVGGASRRPGADDAAAGLAYADLADAGPGGDGTLLPFYLDPMTKLFLVALIWCRPWLDDPSATTPLPRTQEIARGALEVTGAYHELERFDTDAEYRDLLSARVAEHIKVLRRKITDRGLAAADVRLSDEVAVRILIEHGILTPADLSRLDDPAWRSRQEDLWWTQS
jgi:transcriptional regulator with XRE-family HTH domain